MRNLDGMTREGLINIIRGQDGRIERLENDLEGEQRAYKYAMLTMWEEAPEKAADAREQRLALLAPPAEPEPTLVLKPINIAIGACLLLAKEYQLGFAVLAFGAAQIENERHTTISRHTVDCAAIMDKIKGVFRRG